MKAPTGPTTQYDAIKSRDACKNSEAAKSMEGGQQHRGRPSAWMEANSSRDNRNITESTAKGRPTTARMSEIVETIKNSTSISRDANSTIWTPTTHEISWKFAKKSSERRKICEERRKKE
jgi:hypothetical protein